MSLPWCVDAVDGCGFSNGAWSRLCNCLPAARTTPPVNDFGLVDDVPRIVGRGQAWHGADGAVHVDRAAAGAADQMMVVVADPRLVPRRRAGGLDTAEQTHVDQHADGVVDR